MPGDLIQINDLSNYKELQDLLKKKQEQLEEIQKQYQDLKNKFYLFESGIELFRLQLNELCFFLQKNIKDNQSVLQNLFEIKSKLPKISFDD